eukprot:TRINITY_DN1779_c0_g3_i3.p1 TRINITY_DN1779_c0_g3~~TRINITY_DN1779_c0_g3_i3.p1  ORF type:complete len:217 (+),score=38.12 TRINITY_DN1779_c0_g3_i3:14-664(+)
MPRECCSGRPKPHALLDGRIILAHVMRVSFFCSSNVEVSANFSCFTLRHGRGSYLQVAKSHSLPYHLRKSGETKGKERPRFLKHSGARVFCVSATAASAGGVAGGGPPSVLSLVEAALALGARPSQACESQVRRSIKRGLAVILDYLKTVGIVQIPSTMTGMFLGGAQPKEAVAAQLLLLVLMVGTSAIVAIVSAFAAAQSLFTKTYQLVDMDFAG